MVTGAEEPHTVLGHHAVGVAAGLPSPPKRVTAGDGPVHSHRRSPHQRLPTPIILPARGE